MGLLKLLRPAPTVSAAPAPAPELAPDWLAVLAPDELLQPHTENLAKIRQQVGIPSAHWNALYQPLVDGYAAFTQQLPASEAHHHSDRGGLLKHGLETALAALTLRRGILLPPGSSAEQLADKQDVWTYATASAALLHDLGKPVVDQRIALRSLARGNLGIWNPLAGPIQSPATHYSIRYVRGRRYRLHPRLPPMLAHFLVPPLGLEWLMRDLDVFEAWLAVISGGDSELAGPLGQLIRQADGASVAGDLGSEPGIAAAAGARRPLSERLSLALRRLIDSQELPLNRPGAAGFVIGEDLWLVSKRALDAMRDALSADSPGGVPTRNERLMDELQQHGVLMPNQDRAIWMATVELGDWRQPLSLLRIPLPRLWTDPAASPPAVEGRVIVEAPEAVSMNTDDTPGPLSRGTRAPLSSAEPPLPYPPLVDREQSSATVERPHEHPMEVTPAGLSSAQPYPGAPPGSVETPLATELTDNELMQWIAQGLAQARLKINAPDARLHVTREGLLLVSPGIFRDFAGMEGWLNAQKRLIKLKAHLRTPDRTNIWTYRVVGERKSSALLKGILIPEAERRLKLHLPEPNPHLVMVPTTPAQAGSIAPAP